MVQQIDLFDQCLFFHWWIYNQRKYDEYKNLVFLCMTKNDNEEGPSVSVNVL